MLRVLVLQYCSWKVVNKVKQTAGRKQVGDKFIPKELNVS